MALKSWHVHKFGGTSVGNAQRYKNVAQIVRAMGAGPKGIVVSAMKGATDKLIAAVAAAQKRDDAYISQMAALKEWHLSTVRELLKAPNQKAVADAIESDFRDLGEILRGIKLSGIASEKNVELVSGYGEVWSAQLLNAYLREEGFLSTWLDARQVLIVESMEKSVAVDWERSSALLNNWMEKNPGELLVITGFVASTRDGIATTLKRNGSDYSASIFGALLDASEIFIWTDVDGVYSADPRLVPEAVILDELSYNETAELAYFGAKVVHPATMGPAMKKGIPIWIRNTFNPQHKGTKIHGDVKSAKSDSPVKGFSAIDDMALVNIEGTGMIGVPGVSERLFSSLSRAGISVVMISQASSEHSICFAVPQAQAEMAKKAAEQAFYAELHQGLIDGIEVTNGCSILAVVGDNMAHHPGVAGRFLKAMGQADVNVKAIAQGSSERNISVVIGAEDSAKALRGVHSAFYLSDQTLSIGIIGSGLIGSTLINQLRGRMDKLKSERQIDLRVRAVMNSKKMLLDDRRVDLAEGWDAKLRDEGQPADLEKFVTHLRSGQLPHCLIIDATASGDIPTHYPRWLASGFNIIAANKKANTSDQKFYGEIRAQARGHQKHFIYSTNVGAGLPILQTLRDLHQTGDRVLSIEGVLSGTLSYIFNEFTGAKPFSQIVGEAKQKGFTEPDPRDDLSGMDVARKLVILAREMGHALDLKDVDVQSLVPLTIKDGDVAGFMKSLPMHDGEMEKTLLEHKARNEVLRYVGSIHVQTAGGAPAAQPTVSVKVRLQGYPQDHAFARITGSDNILAFRTVRYDRQPLIIQGPGAGPEVTAAGVFADILRLASYLGAPS